MSTRAKKATTKEVKPSFAQALRDTLKNSADALTKQEMLSRIQWDDKIDTPLLAIKISKTLNDQLKNGFLKAENDFLGVTRYRLTGKEPTLPQFGQKKKGYSQTKKVAQERIARKEELEMTSEARAQSDINKIKKELGVMEIPHDYQEAYNRGYNDAMFHSHRDAYNAGRQSVLKGLMKLLNIKGEVLL